MKPLLIEKNPDHLKELSEGFRLGRLSARDYLDRLKSRIEERDPYVKALLPEEKNRFQRLRQELDELEYQYKDPGSRPPLFGVPVGIKDIFHVEGFPTCAGSRIPPEILKGPEAGCVGNLKAAGALILGKTITTEFAFLAPGPTRNPYNPEHTPGGSSSGSAAAVAAGFCPLALGSQTVGSTLRPASFCGVVGFKPSYGRISLEGVIPLAQSVDHVGIFTADAQGAALAASILCEGWKQPLESHQPVFGIPKGPYLDKTGKDGLDHFRGTCGKISKANFEIRSIDMFDDFENIIMQHNTLVAAEAALAHKEWFKNYSGLYREQTAGLIKRGQNVDPEVLEQCRDSRLKLRDEIMKLMEQYGISAFIAPSTVGPAPYGIESTGDPVMNLPWTNAGLPAISIPSGENSEGLPIGLQVVGGWMQDEALLGWAQQLEEIIK